MSTNDVPGARASNNDELAMGCWAEPADTADDKSLIFVEGNEGGTVVYSVFDLDTDMEYRDSMREADFKKYFSWDERAKGADKIKWTWHDKTPFPWARVIGKASAKPGPRHSMAAHLLTAAQKVRDALNLRASKIDRDKIKERSEGRTEDGPSIGLSIGQRLGRALDTFLDEKRG